jgi:hypothetical protein
MVQPVLIILAWLLPLAFGGGGANPATPPVDDRQIVMEGFHLTPQQARALEDRVKADPADANSRIRLLGHYLSLQHTDPAAAAARAGHILWLIRNRPATDILSTPFAQIDPVTQPGPFADAKAAWDKQVDAHPTDTTILGNAAAFLDLPDPEAAGSLLRRAAAADPHNPEWPQHLGELYWHESIGAPADKQKRLAAKSLAAYEQAAALTTSDRDHFYLLDSLATQALAAGDLDKAAKYAHDDLAAAARYPHDWNYGNAIHHAHIVLGSIALQRGDLKAATAHLLDAGRTSGSPQLNSFGPDFALARDLLAKGQRDTVHQYLDLVAKFWTMGRDRLTRWTKDLDQGRTPDFTAFR